MTLSMKRFFFTSILLLFAAYTSPSNAQATPRTITVAGNGVVSGPPDIATVRAGVDTTAASPQAALAANNQQLEQVLAVLTEQGIESSDVQTSFFNVAPQIQFGPNGEDLGITGFGVTNQVRIVVRDLDNLGSILNALVTAGGNRISSVNFGIDNDTELRNRARALAVADATAKAGLLAEAAGVRLGNLISIREQSVPQSVFLGSNTAGLGAFGGSVPIASGELEIQETVFLQFAIDA